MFVRLVLFVCIMLTSVSVFGASLDELRVERASLVSERRQLSSSVVVRLRRRDNPFCNVSYIGTRIVEVNDVYYSQLRNRPWTSANCSNASSDYADWLRWRNCVKSSQDNLSRISAIDERLRNIEREIYQLIKFSKK